MGINEVALAKPRMRDPIKNPNEHIVLPWRKSTSHVNDANRLLAAVQEAEDIIRKGRREAGIDFLGCGSSQSGKIEDKRRAHLEEHAICCVLDNNAPVHEQSKGCVDTLDVQYANCSRQTLAQITIHPPPSISLSKARRLANRALERIANFQARKTTELDLLSIS